ncbi:hypothetical protein Tco_0463424, partial [Tanacetum coccineum]
MAEALRACDVVRNLRPLMGDEGEQEVNGNKGNGNGIEEMEMEEIEMEEIKMKEMEMEEMEMVMETEENMAITSED